MLKIMRSNTKWIMVVVAVCFVAMIIFAWGMDITGDRTGTQAGNIGSINGEDIPYSVYKNVVDMQMQQYGGSNKLEITQQRRIHEESWNTLVQQKVIEQEILSRKISYTDQELVNFMRSNPPQIAFSPELASLFQENGQFSMERYQAFLNPQNLENPQTAQLLQYIEMEAASRLPAMKFQNSLTAAIMVTDSQVRDFWLTDNDKRKADFVFVDNNSIPQDSVAVSTDELTAFFNDNKNDYKKEARRVVASVFIPLAASSADSGEVYDISKLLMEKLASGSSFEELANEYSDDPGNTAQDGSKRGGELGFFGKGRMVPAFDEAVFKLNEGEISRPVTTRFGIHIIRADSLKHSADDPTVVEEVKASHILLRIQPSRDTRDAVEARVTGFRDAVTEGAAFAAQAATNNLNVMMSPPFDKKALTVPGIMGSTTLQVNRAFSGKKGEILQVFFTETGYFIMTLQESLSAGVPDIAEVRGEVERDHLKVVNAKKANEIVTRVYARMNAGKTLEEAVTEDEFKGMQFRTADINRTYYLRGLGTMNAFVAKLFKLSNSGDNTGIFANEDGAGIAVLTEITAIDEAVFEQEKDAIRTRFETEQRNEFVSRYIQGLVDEAKIVDNRHIYITL